MVLDGVYNADAARTPILLTSNSQRLPSTAEGFFEYRPSPSLYAAGNFIYIPAVPITRERVPFSHPRKVSKCVSVKSSELTIFERSFFKIHRKDNPMVASNMSGDEEARVPLIGDPVCVYPESFMGLYPFCG